MFSVGFVLVALGGILVNAGVTNRKVLDVISTALGRKPSTGAVTSSGAAAPGATAFGAGPPAPGGTGDQGDPLVFIVGQPGFRLQPTAAQALQRAEVLAKKQIRVSSAYRTAAQQVDSFNNSKPGMAAAPGHSYHERGLAIDIIDKYDDAIAAALAQTGWHQFDRALEPWHWSFGVTG